MSRSRIFSVILGTLLLAGAAGCASAPRLLDQTRTEPYAGYLVNNKALENSFVRVEAGDPGHPLKLNLRAIRSRSGPSEQLWVFLPGILADHRTFRFLVGFFPDQDMLVIDPPGMGKSDRPKLRSLSDDCYSPAWLARHVLRAVRSSQAERIDTSPLVFFGHSLGGSVIIRILGDPSLDEEFGDMRRRIDAAVLISPIDISIEKPHPMFREIVETPDWKFDVGSFLGILRRKIEFAVEESVVDPDKRALQADADILMEAFTDAGSRRATREMIRKFTAFDNDGTPDWDEQERLQKTVYGNVNCPCLVLWGRRDETFGVSMGYKVSDDIDAKFVKVDRAKHSPHQERPDICATEIRNFLTGNHAKARAGSAASAP